jgi:hypothetical protein
MEKWSKENLVLILNHGIVVVYWLLDHGPVGCGRKASKLSALGQACSHVALLVQYLINITILKNQQLNRLNHRSDQ